MYNPDGSMRAPQRKGANSGGGALSFGFGDSTPSSGSSNNSSKENSPRGAQRFSPNKPDMRAAGVKSERGEKRPEHLSGQMGMHDRRHQEMSGNNVINPASYSGLGERAISTAKHNALYKSNVFSHESNSPKAPGPPPQVSDSKKREMGGSNVFAGDQAMDVAAPRASIAVKQPPGGGSNISFGSSSEPAPHQSTRRPPGGSSSFIFG
ncbi:hypothetical protein WJX74_008919 [Apatococcus lobatus]|uniref:Microtubule-associated protein Jupiter n=2 Tax=Apatococcus TaxID=904362 RepID=A0AAW1SSX9_9CHLO